MKINLDDIGAAIYVPRDNTQIFFPSILRHIAAYIGVLSKEDVVEFLIDCDVPKEQIPIYEKSEKILFHLFKKLETDKERESRQLLLKIIAESIDADLYKQPNRTEKEILDTYNKWLKPANIAFKFLNHQYTPVISVPRSKWFDDMAREVIELELDLLDSAVKNYKEYIAEIRNGYKLLLQIVDVFSQRVLSSDQQLQLNTFYIELFKLIKSDIQHIHAGLTVLYEESEKNPTPYPADNTYPYIYNYGNDNGVLFQPYTNLYLAQIEMQEKHIAWEDIRKDMDLCFGYMEDFYHRFEVVKAVALPHKQFLGEVATYLQYLVKTDYNDFFGFEDSKFWLKRIAAENLTISFHPKNGATSDTLCLLHAFVDYLKKNGSFSNGLLSVIVPREDIIGYIKTNYPQVDTMRKDWIGSTKHNLLQKMTDDDKKFISIEDHDGKIGYPFSIKLSRNNPPTP